MELLESHLAPFLYLRLILAVLISFEFDGGACSPGLEFYLGAEYPFRGELIVESESEARYGYSVSVVFRASLLLETVDAIVLERGHYLSVASEAEPAVARCVGQFLTGCGYRQHQGRG